MLPHEGEKVNTSGYHPQTNGLVERFHQTLIQMLSLYVEKHGRDWNRYLPYLLYAYCISAQESVRESPFYSTAVIPDNPLMRRYLVPQLHILLTPMITIQNWSMDFPMRGKLQLNVLRLLKGNKRLSVTVVRND